MQQQTKCRPLHPSPQLRANCLSKSTLWWVNNILKLGYLRPLRDADIYDVLPDDSSVKLSNDLGREWDKELYQWRSGGRPSLLQALGRCYWLWLLCIGITFFFVEALRVAQAVLLGWVVQYFQPDSDVSHTQAYMYCGCWVVCYMLVSVLDNVGFHKSAYFGLKIRVACTSLIYRKILRLSRVSLHETSAASIGSLMSTDAHRFEQSCLGINYIWIGPLQALAVITLLWKQLDLGPVCLVGVVMVCILAPIQYCVGDFLSKLRTQQAQCTDNRVHTMSEILAGMSTIKVNCWEKAYCSLVDNIRGSEWLYLRAMCHCRGVNSALYFAAGKLLMFATFSTYLLLGGEIQASTLFSALVLYEILKSSVGLLLPWGVHYFVQSVAAVYRIQEFLLLEEKSSMEDHSVYGITKSSVLSQGEVIRLDDYTASWNKGHGMKILEKWNLSVLQGQLVAVTGPAGSGKTSLLSAISGELLCQGGSVKTRGRAILSAQQPWIFTGTIRDNIVFGGDWDRNWYNRVLYACSLMKDLEGLPQGDQSLVKDKGVSLTNGQRARIGLARAVYYKADIYLIDSILEIMQKDMATNVYTRCLRGLLKAKTVVIVTEDIDLLKTADQIVVTKMGKQLYTGTYDDLCNQGVDFHCEEDNHGNHGNHDNNGNHGNPAISAQNKSLASITSGEIYRPETTLLKAEVPVPEASMSESKSSIETLVLDPGKKGHSGLDHLGSQESLDQILLEFESITDSDLSSTTDKLSGKAVGWGAYQHYFQAAGGMCALLTLLTLALFSQVLYILCDWWLYHWSTHQSTKSQPQYLNSSATQPHVDVRDPEHSFYSYLALLVCFTIMSFLKAMLLNNMAVKACRVLHNMMFASTMRAPTSFFEKNSVSQILGRFGRDVSAVDDILPVSIMDCLQFTCLVAGTVVMVTVANYWMILLVIPLTAIFTYVRHIFLQSSRELKRLEQLARVPVYQHLCNTLDGLGTLRLYSAESRFLRHFDSQQDRHTATVYLALAAYRWFAMWLDGLALILVATLPFLCVAVEDYSAVDSGLLGLSMAYTVNLLALFQHSVRLAAEVSYQMTSVDRVTKCSEVSPEPELYSDTRVNHYWPQYGIVTLEGVTVVQPETGSKVIRNMMCCFRAYEMIGILSDSDASLKALASALLRLTEVHGFIRIDGLDIAELGLHDLREKVALVPQDPMLFACSMRRNLDPFTRYPDATLWKALEHVQLKEKLEAIPGDIYAEVASYTLSQGERQLVALARTLVRNCRVILFEESRSIINKRTEQVIGHTLRTKFPRCTVIVLAQKLPTVIDLDRVMVLLDGRVREVDPAHVLLQDDTTILSQMLHKLPETEQTRLRELAQDKHDNKPYVAPPQSLGGEPVIPHPGGRNPKNFLPSFQTNRISGVLSHFSGNRFSTNRF